jgi:hypothetical protein
MGADTGKRMRRTRIRPVAQRLSLEAVPNQELRSFADEATLQSALGPSDKIGVGKGE